MERNVDLLRLEMATLWERDAYGRLRAQPLVAIAVADDGLTARFDPALPRDLRRDLEKVSIGDRFDLATLEQYKRLIEPFAAVELKGGPSYVFPREGVEIGTSDLQISTSEDVVSSALRVGRPDAWWEPEEWEDLLAGRLGPWAIGVAGDSVAAICHTPVGSLVAAEAGVWTHPNWRGRGNATAVTAAWAEVARGRFETLFYSTGSDNAASQGVARKLGLRSVGWIWQIHACG